MMERMFRLVVIKYTNIREAHEVNGNAPGDNDLTQIDIWDEEGIHVSDALKTVLKRFFVFDAETVAKHPGIAPDREQDGLSRIDGPVVGLCHIFLSNKICHDLIFNAPKSKAYRKIAPHDNAPPLSINCQRENVLAISMLEHDYRIVPDVVEQDAIEEKLLLHAKVRMDVNRGWQSMGHVGPIWSQNTSQVEHCRIVLI